MVYTFYELLWMFLIYAFFGWCLEVMYHTVETGEFANRGFLNGPVCPIYGVGATLVIAVLSRVDNIFAMFILSMLLTSVLELITGFALKKIYHTSWWDYSDKPFNLGGYICLEFSILWGLACVGVMEIVHPLIMDFIHIIPNLIGKIMLGALFGVFAADVVVTVTAMQHLTRRVRLLDETAASIRRVSDGIGENLHETVSDLEKRRDEFAKSGRAEELRRKYDALINESHILERRIIKAFPKMKSLNHGEQFENLKQKVKNKRK